MIQRFLLFLTINFLALFLGATLQGNPMENTWYQAINKAPWTPPGAVFGIAWFTIMILFSVALAILFKDKKDWKSLSILFSLQFVLNVSWNPLFFVHHYTLLGLIILVVMFIVVLLLATKKRVKSLPFLLTLPYLIWLCIAFSLNFYVWKYN